MEFRADEPQTVTRGNWNYDVTLNGGACVLTFSMAGNAFKPVPNGDFIVDGAEIIHFGTCRLKAGLTGDATFTMIRAK